MGEPQRRCSICGESYAVGVIFCPSDGNALATRAGDGGPDPYLGQTLQGGYRIDALIGAGAVGRVYRARQLAVERDVALKIMHRDLALDPTLQSRFRREARIAGSLEHPNLARVLLLSDLEQNGLSVPFLVLEYLEGVSLRSALAAQGALPVDRTLHILLQISDALGEAHQRGIVHRDLKPENVMLVQRGDDPDFVKLLDFGVARVIGEQRVATVATRAGAIFGSARYVAPECAMGGASSPASDVYALATLAYECLTGSTPFDGDNAIQVLLKQQSQPVPALSEGRAGKAIGSELARCIEQNLAKTPDARSPNARAFGEALARATNSGPFSCETRKGYANPVLPASPASPAPSSSRATLPKIKRTQSPPPPTQHAQPRAPSPRMPRWAFICLCFALGASAALGVAAKLGALSEPDLGSPKTGTR